MFLKLEKAAAKVGLQCNEEKTAYMMVKRRESFPPVTTLNTGKYIFNRVEHFKYLGIIITEHNKIARELAVRIQTGNKCFYGLAKILRSQSLFKKSNYILL